MPAQASHSHDGLHAIVAVGTFTFDSPRRTEQCHSARKAENHEDEFGEYRRR